MAISDLEALADYQQNWNKFIRDILRLKIDREQEAIVDAVQRNRKVAVRSGNGRGKDFVSAALMITFLQLYYPSKVIGTAPTGRQTVDIVMPEVASAYNRANTLLKDKGLLPLGGEVLSTGIKMAETDDRNWFLTVFKADDTNTEAWTGYHSPNLFVSVTEASGIAQETFDAIESLLTGNSRLFIVGNPNEQSGGFYNMFSDPQFTKFALDSLLAPNVVADRIIYPGQVDYTWINERVHKTGWTTPIDEDIVDDEFGDFWWDDQWYRPSDLFLIKVRGRFPRTPPDLLIPRPWLDAAVERWRACGGRGEGPLSIGADIAGLGSDNTVTAHRRDNVIEKIKMHGHVSDHMQAAGLLKSMLQEPESTAYVDSIGEGAGVYSRLEEMEENVVSAKFSLSAKGYKDATEEREFVNMRAYCYWAFRDALDPNLDGKLALPPCDELYQDLSCTKWRQRSTGGIYIIPKDEIRKELGRSPDFADAVALSFFPEPEFAIAGGYSALPQGRS